VALERGWDTPGSPGAVSQQCAASTAKSKCGSFDFVWPEGGQTSLKMTVNFDDGQL
jgi:hypothetical protein